MAARQGSRAIRGALFVALHMSAVVQQGEGHREHHHMEMENVIASGYVEFA